MTRKIIFTTLALAMLVPVFAFAAPIMRAGQTEAIKDSENITDDAYLAGGMLTMTGNVAGDFVGAGGNLFIAGHTTNDVIVAGGSLTITGSIGDDLRAAGGNITISSSVADDVIVAGGQVNIVSGTVIGGDLVVMGGQVTMEGTVRGAVHVTAGDVTINGETGDVSITSGHVVIGPKAMIQGKLDYSSVKKAEILDGSVITGPITYTQVKQPERNNIAGIISVILIIKLISLFVIALVLQWVLGRIAVRTVTDSLKGIWGNLGRGFVALIIIPVAIIVLCVTVIGIPLALVALFSYIALVIFSSVFVAVFLGAIMRKYYRKSEKIILNWETALVGSLAAFILGLIPVIGCLALFLAFLIVLGTLVRLKMEYFEKLR